MIKLKNYWRATSPKIKKLSLWLKSTIGALALSAYATSEVKTGFYLLIAGAIIDGVLQLLPPDDSIGGYQPNTCVNTPAPNGGSGVPNKILTVIALLGLLLIGSCRVIKPEVDHTKTDSTITSYKQFDIKVPGAKVFAGLNMDSLYHAALMARDQRSEDSILRLNMELKYKQDSINALKANKPIPVKPVYIPSPPKKQYVTDPQTKAQLSYWIDAYGKFQISCESKDQTIKTLQAQVTKLTKDVTTQKLLVDKTPVWNWIAIAVLATLLAISLLINFINRKS